MYSITDYGKMINNAVRMDAYANALRQAVKPGSVVLDIGTGTGIFALLACQFGARHVYAIESSDAIQVAREIASANGYREKISFIQGVSTKIELPEQADVIISDLRSVLPLFQTHITSIADARKRFLAPEGCLIPQKDILWVTVVEAPELYKDYQEPWRNNSYGLDMEAGRKFVVNTWRKCRDKVKPEHFLVEPQIWATLDYTTIEDPNVSGAVKWIATRAAIAHGFSIWFDATLAESITFSNAPGEPELVYGNAFFPLPEPVSIVPDDVIAFQIHTSLVGDDYLWRWETSIKDSTGQVKANFKQLSFFGFPLSQKHLRKPAANYTPRPSEDSQTSRLVLD